MTINGITMSNSREVQSTIRKGIGELPVGGTVMYESEYGYVEFELVGEFQEIKTFRTSSVPDDFKFDMDVAEQIALLTSNFSAQLVFEFPLTGKCCVVVHCSPNMVAPAKIKKLDYTCPRIARLEIEGHAHNSDRVVLGGLGLM